MISELTAAHTSTRASHFRPFAGAVADFTGVRTSDWLKRFQVVAKHASTLVMALLSSLSSGVRPSYFELEQRGPTHHRLGPGLSRESDSFWPLSEW
jgi:hypothetical protein